MKRNLLQTIIIMALFSTFTSCSHTTKYTSPEEMYGNLFTNVMSNDSLFGENALFADSKTFLDATPKREMAAIVEDYNKLPNNKETKVLTQFLENNFLILPSATTKIKNVSDINTHIKRLWNVLLRRPQAEEHLGTLIPLKHDYFIPGGRFHEVYYWDSYFSMLGMFADGDAVLAKNMIQNFADLIDELGFIPNGNRTYYLGRSQPPFFSYMVDLLAEHEGDKAYVKYLPQLQKEYDFWMKDTVSLTPENPASLHCVRMKDGEVLNRYYDLYDTPREEMYRNDIETAQSLKASYGEEDVKSLFRNLRAGAESGWDFSSRWLGEGHNLFSIHTTDIVPVDLNCLLYHLETVLSKAYQLSGDTDNSNQYAEAASIRKAAIQKYLWSDYKTFYMDYNFKKGDVTNIYSLAGVYPLFVGIASPEQAATVLHIIKSEFLKDGGVVTTLNNTGQQWDYPNGWAPLQWITYNGMKNYNDNETAALLKERWMGMVENVYNNTHKLLEKYDVVKVSDTGGGEYPNQDGFGWTNGVYRAFATSED